MTIRKRLSKRSLIVDRRAAYLAGTSRSVGRGWPYGHFLPDFSLNGKKIKMFYSDAEEAWVDAYEGFLDKNFNPNEPLQRSRM
jgi:hypothetical protein